MAESRAKLATTAGGVGEEESSSGCGTVVVDASRDLRSVASDARMIRECRLRAAGIDQAFMLGDAQCREVAKRDRPGGESCNDGVCAGVIVSASRDNEEGQFACTVQAIISEEASDDVLGETSELGFAAYSRDAAYDVVFDGCWRMRSGSLVLYGFRGDLRGNHGDSFDQTRIRVGVYRARVAALDDEKTWLRVMRRQLGRRRYLMAVGLHSVVSASWVALVTGVPGVLLIGIGSGRIARALEVLLAVGPWVAAVALLGAVAHKKLALLRTFGEAMSTVNRIIDESADVIVQLRLTSTALPAVERDAAVVV